MRTRELIARGMDPTTARDTAFSRIGDVSRLKRTRVHLGRKRDCYRSEFDRVLLALATIAPHCGSRPWHAAAAPDDGMVGGHGPQP